jgi:hypothetical protein
VISYGFPDERVRGRWLNKVWESALGIIDIAPRQDTDNTDEWMGRYWKHTISNSHVDSKNSQSFQACKCHLERIRLSLSYTEGLLKTVKLCIKVHELI